MNNLGLLRFVSRSQIFSLNYNNYNRYLQLMAKGFVTENLTKEEIKEKQLFHAALPGIIEKLQAGPNIIRVPEVGRWIQKMMEHHVRTAYHTRGILMFSYEMLERPKNITEENIKLSRVLGWCVEMAQGYVTIADDIMDASTTRGGISCWHCLPNVGINAVNDAILMNCCLTETIENYFIITPYYIDVVQLFNKALLCVTIGQHLDLTANQKDYSMFTIERFNTITHYKAKFITFWLPILLGLTLVKNVDKRIYGDVDNICMGLARLYQMQNDYLDCYGDVVVTGKVGTDIQEGKCTWLAATAYQLCNKEQKELFAKYFHSSDQEHVAIIKNLYNELNLPELFRQRENELRDEIRLCASALPLNTAPRFFDKVLERIFKRQH